MAPTRPTRRTALRALAALAAVSVLVVAVVARLDSGDPDRGVTGSLSGTQPAPQQVVPGQRIGEDYPPEATLPTIFRISSFNILGYGHTAPNGNRKGWADGRTRMRLQIDLLTGHDIDIVGFQEFQPEQFQVFTEEVGTEWGVYPGDKLARAAMHNSIAWRKDTWRLVQPGYIAIPYFGGTKIRMPVILLRHAETGQEAYFGNFHNPANARGNAERWRDQATNLQIGMANRLRTETGLPVFITGDMNEKAEYFCRLTRGAPMVAANGGSNDSSGCRVPMPTQVDWIFGPVETSFSDYLADRSAAVRKTTDHPMVIAEALLPPRTEVNSCQTSPVPC